MYLCPQDFPDGGLELERVVVVHRHDMRSADILFCVRVLWGHLRKVTEGGVVGSHRTYEVRGGRRRGERTSLEVGLPLKNSWLSELWGGWNLGWRNMQPLAMASSGAGPSYGKPKPMKSWNINEPKPFFRVGVGGGGDLNGQDRTEQN